MIIELDKLAWPFESEPYYTKLHGHKFDPFPGYPHNAELVESMLDLVKSKTGEIPPLDINYYLAHHEAVGRTNAWASDTYDYEDYDEDAKRYRKIPYVLLSGKRIPPHPAMTRHLVAHEYGHHVQWHVEQVLGMKDGHEELRPVYGKLREMEAPDYYGGGTWHKSIGEVFADDFRILVCGVELEYWPHSGIEYPDLKSDYAKWWKALVKDGPDKWESP